MLDAQDLNQFDANAVTEAANSLVAANNGGGGGGSISGGGGGGGRGNFKNNRNFGGNNQVSDVLIRIFFLSRNSAFMLEIKYLKLAKLNNISHFFFIQLL